MNIHMQTSTMTLALTHTVRLPETRNPGRTSADPHPHKHTQTHTHTHTHTYTHTRTNVELALPPSEWPEVKALKMYEWIQRSVVVYFIMKLPR